MTAGLRQPTPNKSKKQPRADGDQRQQYASAVVPMNGLR